METKKDKQAFIADVKKRISNREELKKFYNEVFLPTLKKFNGKVYNARFINALNEGEKDREPRIWAKFEGQTREKITIVLKVQNDRYNYSDTESLYIELIANYEDFNHRISEADTLAGDMGKNYLKNFDASTDELRAIVKGYDKYMKVADKLKDTIKEFNELPYDFRKNLQSWGLHIYI